MNQNEVQVLQLFLHKYQNDSELAPLTVEFNNIKTINEPSDEELNQLISCYKRAIPIIERNIWNIEYDEDTFLQYQALFREMENHISRTEPDRRHHFFIIIPVADRPQHLRKCLESILQLCECFQYGGRQGNHYQKVTVIISDDSQLENNIDQHRELTQTYTEKGLKTEYFGLEEQIKQIQHLEPQMQKQLESVIGNVNRQAFYHKGASITRNIAYLRLMQLSNNHNNPLYYFIDSDQEFKLNIPSENNKVITGLNYFYHLDRLFSEHQIKILTGKVVGDPPVSPAVMAANFLDDIIAFLETMVKCPPEKHCTFHSVMCDTGDDAAYHDMAELFGYKKEKTSFQYACPLEGSHDHQDCFVHFAEQINHFFDGEHPTRSMYFQYKNIADSLAPARTVYTGNYVFKPELLQFFIPFAPLKLRMAGPVLGRLIRAEIGEQFVSANLPMLHKRTVEEIGQSEFRPGIKRQDDIVDLSGEFVRQFFGDVMLFSIDALTDQGYPVKLSSGEIGSEYIINTIKNTEDRLLQQYREQQQRIKTRLRTLISVFTNKAYWWNNMGMDSSLSIFANFIENMTLNFGDEAKAYQHIQNHIVREQYRHRILESIRNYPESKRLWHQSLKFMQQTRVDGST